MASSWERNIRAYFKDWDFVSHVPQQERDGDPRPRSLSSLCFRNRLLERVPLNELRRGHHQRGIFCEEIEKGTPPLETEFYKNIRRKRRSISDEELQAWMFGKIALYEDVKKNGIKEPVIIDRNNAILDGNYRVKMLRFLGYRSTIARRV
jgi:hypothetical protein